MRIKALVLLLALTPLPAAAQQADTLDLQGSLDAPPSSPALIEPVAIPGTDVELTPSVPPTNGDDQITLSPSVTDGDLGATLKIPTN